MSDLVVLAFIISLFVLSAIPLGHINFLPKSSATTDSSNELTIAARPQVLPADAGTYPAIVLQFVDLSTHLPIIPNNSTTVYLSSSNRQTGIVPASVTFPAGTLYYDVNFTTTTLPGYTTIYAVAQGYKTVSMTLETETVGGIPTGLDVFMSPNQILAETNMSSQVIVEAVDAFGNPVNLGSSIAVSLSSSNTFVGNVSSSLTIPTNESYAQERFTPTSTPGETVITASASGLNPGTAVMTTVSLPSNVTENSLFLQFGPPVLFSDGRSYQNIVVAIVNSLGFPYPAASDTVVTLTSSTASVGRVQSSIVIPTGETYARATFSTYGLAGRTVITATASNLATAQGQLNFVTKAATTLGIYAVPNWVISQNSTYNNLVVELQDGSGNPEKSTFPVTVSLQSLYPTTGTVPTKIVIPSGSTYATVPLTTTDTSGQIVIDAFATGFILGHVNVTSSLLPLSVSVVPSPVILHEGGTSKLTLTVMSGQFPVQDASVQWIPTSGQLSSESKVTDSSGLASAVITASTTLPTITVSVRVTSPGYSIGSRSTTLIVNQTQATHSGGILGIFFEQIFFVPIWGFIAIGAAAPTTAFFFLKRRSVKGADYGIEEEL